MKPDLKSLKSMKPELNALKSCLKPLKHYLKILEIPAIRPEIPEILKSGQQAPKE